MAHDRDNDRDRTEYRLGRHDNGHGRPRREARRHGDPYGEIFARSLREDGRERPAHERPVPSRPPVGVRGGRGSAGNPRYSGGYGSDRGGVTYGLSGAEGGFDEDDLSLAVRDGFDPVVGPGAYGGQQGGLSGGYGRRGSGVRSESAAVAGAFGGRRDAPQSGSPDMRGPDMRGKGPKDYIRSDDRIREVVCEVFTDDPLLDAGDIEVSVVRGEVTLTGTVSARAAKRHAEDLAETVSGVRHVQNNLRVNAGGPGFPTE